MKYKLIYINKQGYNWEGYGTYEFIFCDDTTELEDVWGDGWESTPADGMAYPPDVDCVAKVGVLLAKDYELGVAHQSQTFGLCDVKDGVLALGWEEIDENFSLSNQRLVFKFGDSLTDIEAQLSKRKLQLKYEK